MTTSNPDYSGVPKDFPVGSQAALSGAQPKLAMVKIDDAYYPAGSTPDEVIAAHEMCEDLAQQLVPYCQRKLSENPQWNEADVLRLTHAGVVKKGWCTPAQAAWTIRRTAVLLSWPAPDLGPGDAR